ncbi:MAG: amidohydrolase family protein [Burkholderiales bacterium]|nr:amidohydrolase family protein [Burkholderiales bacterium]
MDLVLHNARTEAATGVDIGIRDGRIAAIAPRIDADCARIDVGGRLVAPGFVETHIHLDKSCILDRCHIERGTLDEAIAQVSKAKRAFTPDDVYARASRTLEKAIVHGTTRLRTHVEVDPVIGLKGFEGIERLAAAYRWAADIEICVFPQEGLTNYPGTEELMREALARGARVVGAAPYTDTDSHAQIDRVFRMARDFDVDIDMHLDLGDSTAGMDAEYVCAMTEQHRYGGRVAIGHVTKMSFLPPDRFAALAKRLADAGVAVTVLPATDLFLMGRQQTHSHVRGVLAAHHLLHHGVNCSLATNNVLNPFTPFGDGSLLRMANLYANVCHIGTREGMRDSFDMITRHPAKLMRLPDHGLAEGCAADLVVLDCATPEEAVAELVTPLFAYKRGRRTFTRDPARIHRP